MLQATIPKADMSQFDRDYDSVESVARALQTTKGRFSLILDAKQVQPVVYNITAIAVQLPEQPDQMVQMQLSVILSRSNLTPEISSAIATCLAFLSETEFSNWGMFRAKRFTPRLLQVEYFAHVKEQASGGFPLAVEQAIKLGNLTRCVVQSEVGLPDDAGILPGRTSVAPKATSVVSATGGIAAWIVGIVIGVVGIAVFVGLVVVSVREGGSFKEEDYEIDEEEAGLGDKEALETVAGQRVGALVVQH